MPSCLPTCQVPEPSCTPHPFCIPGCGCPGEMVYDETKQQCIQRTSCGKSMDFILVLPLFMQIHAVFLLILVLVLVNFQDGFIILLLNNVNCFYMVGVVETVISLCH